MNVRTKRMLIDGVAEHWKLSYALYFPPHNFKPDGLAFGNPVTIYNLLVAMPPTATEADVEAIIGNGSWTRNQCDNCERDVDATIELKSGNDDEYGPARYCLSCIATAHKKLKGRA